MLKYTWSFRSPDDQRPIPIAVNGSLSSFPMLCCRFVHHFTLPLHNSDANARKIALNWLTFTALSNTQTLGCRYCVYIPTYTCQQTGRPVLRFALACTVFILFWARKSRPTTAFEGNAKAWNVFAVCDWMDNRFAQAKTSPNTTNMIEQANIWNFITSE